MSFVDTLFGSTPELLRNRSQRLEMLSSNLANADTPGYKAVDVDFESIFAQEKKGANGMQLNTTNQQHLSSRGKTEIGSAQLETLYRVPHQSRLDGNTVETDVERMKFMDNALRYQAGLNFLGGKVGSIISTLRGE